MFKLTRRRLVLLAAVVLLLFWLGSSAVVARMLTRRFASYPEPPPRIAWAKVESQRLTTSDNQQIGAWLVRGDPQKPCVLLLHGIYALRGQMLQVLTWLAEAHYTAMAITFRGHGDSTGEVIDVGWSGQFDVIAGAEFLRRNFPGRRLFVVGRSMARPRQFLRPGNSARRSPAICWSSPTRT